MEPLWESPDCRDGNHQKCYGEAFDEDNDKVVPCGCLTCHPKVSDR